MQDASGVIGEAAGRSHIGVGAYVGGYVDLALIGPEGGVDTPAELLDGIAPTGPARLIFGEAALTGDALPSTPRRPAVPRASYG